MWGKINDLLLFIIINSPRFYHFYEFSGYLPYSHWVASSFNCKTHQKIYRERREVRMIPKKENFMNCHRICEVQGYLTRLWSLKDGELIVWINMIFYLLSHYLLLFPHSEDPFFGMWIRTGVRGIALIFLTKLSMFRFTFNAAKGACERVVYGGCGGSGNLFVSEADCVTTCLHPSQDQRPEIVITFPAR